MNSSTYYFHEQIADCFHLKKSGLSKIKLKILLKYKFSDT